ncbi:secreted protein-like protein [Leptotrombidium deliense]|uniref:Secreted protein-like protein n=1 Tax=Leptotrombidium deliense TaxID=299467 RepID=A0A443SDC6_9ACAR|nr:secreted protein-like protein [Leptotrombidium deliense]
MEEVKKSHLNPRRKSKSKLKKKCFLSEEMRMQSEVNSEDVTRVIMITYFRSGSTFLGDLLQQKQLSFYSFEPLRYLTRSSRITKSSVNESLNVIDKILNCEFESIIPYVVKTKKLGFFKAKIYKDICGTKKVNVELLTEVCKRCKLNVIKLTRLNFSHAATYLKSTKYSNVKLLHLVRDPRAIYNSRKSFQWCRNSDCINVQHLCAEMLDDFKASQALMKKFPDQVYRLRHEHIATDMQSETKKLFKFLGIEYTSEIDDFINSHRDVPGNIKPNKYSTVRNSKYTTIKWKEQLTKRKIEEIEYYCKDVIQALNYTFVMQ